MGIQIADQFTYSGSKPLDARLQFSTVANMKAAAESSLYNGCFAYVIATKKYYSFDSSNSEDPTTGKWREYESGGVSDYPDLTNKPQINGYTLSGNKTGANLGLQNTTLSTPITVNGTQCTTVEQALTELNVTDKSLAYTDVTGRIGVNHFTFDDATLVDAGEVKIFLCLVGSYYGDTNLPYDSAMSSSEIKEYIVKMARYATPSINSDWFSQECWVFGNESGFVRVFARKGYLSGSTWTIKPWVEIGVGGSDITAGTGLELNNDEMSIKEFESGDMEEILAPLPSSAPRYMTYSTEEQVIGQWIDGDKIYQKTVTGTVNSSGNTTLLTDLPKTYKVVNWHGYLSKESYMLPVPNTNGDSSGQVGLSYALLMDTNYWSLKEGGSNTYYRGGTYYITAQYTKE